MNKLLRLIVPVLALGLGLVALPSSADACECTDDVTPKAALSGADAVFVGQMAGSRRLPASEDGSSPQMIEYKFEISHSYKGPQGRAVVRSEYGTPSCGREFDDGVIYLVYASKVNEVLTDTKCSRTRPAADAIDDFKEIGYPPADAPDDAASGGGSKLGEPTFTAAPSLRTETLVATSPSQDLITSQCQTIVEGELTAAQFAEVVTYTGANGFLCTRQLVVTGNVELAQPNLRVVALDMGGFEIAGNLLIWSPSVLMGATVSGTVLMSERAAGSVLVGNRFAGAVLVATSQFIGLGNNCEKQCVGPGGTVGFEAHVPSSATGVVRQVPRARVTALSPDDMSKVIGWLAPEAPYQPKYEDKPELKEVDLSDLASLWPPPIIDNGGSDDPGSGWIPVYGQDLPATGSESIWGVFVPLEAGRFRQPELGFFYVP